MLYPLINSFYYSLTKYDLNNSPVFTGSENIKRLLKDDIFFKSIGNSFYAAVGVPIGMFLSLCIALLLNRKDIRGKNVFRMFFFMPTICSAVAVTLMWGWVLNTDYGLINQLLKSLFNIAGPHWFSEELAMPSMIIMGVWGGLGIGLLFYLAALNNVPTVYYEAATVDGASSFKKFWYITLPGISPVTFYIFVTGIIGALQDFTRFKIMTGGGPNWVTTTSVLYIYKNALEYYDYGYASLMAWGLGLIIMVVTIINFVFSKKWVNYD